ncbi:MAG: ABC transporter ATP-binding protein [Lachnospiraceae bacterium]|nr:ABC transporter ATP-binding protein [Lachnospiraceae bacterium]
MEENKKMDLELINVSKSFQTKNGEIQALSPVNMTIPDGTFLTILGPSGCGKSTLIRIIAGLETATTGEVRIGDKKVEGPGADRGMVFQSYTLFPWLNVEQNIAFGLELKGVPKAEIRDKVDEYLEYIGLKNFRYHFPEQLSGGMKQRVAIARALINDPKILLMDEPFGALDAQTRIIMQEVLQDIWQKTQKTVIFITHDVDEAVFLGDQVFVMTAMPGTLKHIEPVTFARPRKFELKMQMDFMQTSSKLLEMIREESFKALR